MHPILLHGATGFWDEIFCLVVPLTAITGLALALMRQEQHRDETPAPPSVDDDPGTAAVGDGRAAGTGAPDDAT